MPQRSTYKFAYYCSGHGFGHATRVAAISFELLVAGHTVFIITSAPRSVFESAFSLPRARVSYRYAEIEPAMVQPKAYDVDRSATFDNLERFINSKRRRIIDEETDWLKKEGIDCVLVDAPFVPCAAAEKAGIRSVIISNFTFCSCYSYLSMESQPSPCGSEPIQAPVDAARLEPLVKVAIADYAKADLLLRLPGAIPIPAFDTDVELPATRWVNPSIGSFKPEIHKLLDRPVNEIARQVWEMPLVVRPVSRGIYHPSRKLELLERLGVPEPLRSKGPKILLVSFGGQIISCPQPDAKPSASLLPPGWIAVVCGTYAESFAAGDPHIYAISHDSYVPDLTALADVVLGKLGYGTCSEALATMTPFVYVPRPMFVEEYGLKRMMEGVASVEMSREDFESGRWAEAIAEADRVGHRPKTDFVRRQCQASAADRSAKPVVEALERFLGSVSVGVVEVLKAIEVEEHQRTHIACSS
ncbi:hypothetical protein CROQUDRAFT_98200 [Cronartium quercuum f. sp. fusiforme G11]|uniref:L-arabinokinase n=1 Tax=Cronartium quercuum f. sp. fusiforme G11 TaxID=708437 RepID=A0A9P6N8I8_9BASI|nr:hypothetical protein CROQUDRAFT_98200 [Cronartium quercuum f. sp. fusiforme G11]